MPTIWSVRPTVRTRAAALSLALAAGLAIARPAHTTSAQEPALKAQALERFALVNGEEVAVPDIQMGDPAVIDRIIAEGTKRNRVMEHLTFLCEQIGPRLTGSSNAEAANKWARDRFESFGLANAHLDQWGEISMRFDRGPSAGAVLTRRARRVTGENGAESTEPEYTKVRDLQFTTLAWAPGTDGALRGPVFRMPETIEQLEAIESELDNAWILIPNDYNNRRGIRGVGGQMRARHKYWDELRDTPPAEAEQPAAEQADAAPDDPIAGDWAGTLKGPNLPGEGMPITLKLTRDSDRAVAGQFGVGGSMRPFENGTFDEADGKLTFTRESSYGTFTYELTLRDGKLSGAATTENQNLEVELARAEAAPAEPSQQDEINRRILAADPHGFIVSSMDERVWTTSADGWREMTRDTIPSDVQVCVNEPDYDYINSRIVDGAPIEVEFDLEHTFTPGPIPVYNTVAEIPGTDFPDEVIIVSAHLDSWNGPGSQGTTDNGTGSSVTIEAARILAAAGAKPKRTIRFILWTGEEQGLLGSRSWVERNEGSLEKISAVFVDDGGTNYEGGLQCIESMAPMLAAATAPVNGLFKDAADGKPLNVNIQTNERMPRGGGSDHASFNAKGVPGFFWDEVGRAEYGYGWHTQHDRLDLAIPEYLQQSATCAAITAYNLACAPTMLPRQLPDEPTPPSTEQQNGAAATPPAEGAAAETKPADGR